MSKTYSLLLNIKVDTKETNDGKELHSYSFKAWKDVKITKGARAFDWTEPMFKKQTGNMQDLGEKSFLSFKMLLREKVKGVVFMPVNFTIHGPFDVPFSEHPNKKQAQSTETIHPS